MANVTFCSQCGPGSTPDGILFEKRPDYIDAVGLHVKTNWERVGAMCQKHLRINGEAAKSNGMEVKIEPLSQAKIEAKG